MTDDNPLMKTLERMQQKEPVKKKKPAFSVPKEKRLQYYSGWENKKEQTRGVSTMDEEIGRIKKSDTTEIVIKVDDYGGQKGITIREYLTSERYTGFTKQGTRIPAEKWEEFKALVSKVKLETGP